MACDTRNFPSAPPLVWKHFQALCAIPRPSGHEQQAVRYVTDTARALGLDYFIDKTGNIIVRKNVSPGFEGRAGIVLQSHLDMVPQKNEGTAHDFLTDPINAYIDGDWMKARGTTLGADNGTGAAIALAVLEDAALQHGPIEALFTVDEEAGMTGAKGLEPGVLKGSVFINLDTEDEGEIFIGCAGGVDLRAVIPVDYDSTDKNCAEILLSVTGLKGGHSGLDINLGRGNAVKILIRCLHRVCAEFNNICISSIRGGSVRNAIPREAFCELTTPQNDLDRFTRHIKEFENIVKAELSVSDSGVTIGVGTPRNKITKVMTPDSQIRLIRALYACPNGVIRMSDDAPGIVETSGNLAIVNAADNGVEAQCLLRSLVDTARDDLAAMAESAFSLAGAEVRVSGEYPGWKPDPHSRLLNSMKKVYRETFGVDPAVKVVHAGLECGIIAAKYPQMEFVSVGPTIKHPHSPDECLHIPSVEKFWKYLTAALTREI